MWSLNIAWGGRVGWDGDRGTVGVHLKVLEGRGQEEQPRFPWARSAQLRSHLLISFSGVLPIWRGSADISRRDPSSYSRVFSRLGCPIFYYFLLSKHDLHSASPRQTFFWISHAVIPKPSFTAASVQATPPPLQTGQ